MNTPSLLAYLVHQIIAPVKRKGLFSGEYVFFAEYLSQAQLLYEIGAVLGYTYRDRLETFAESFSEPGRQADLTNYIATETFVDDRLAALPDKPKNFYDLFLESEGKKLMKKMHEFGLTQFSDWLDFPKVCKLKMPIRNYFERLQTTALEGIQLGSQYSELTEKLFSYEYDAEEWHRWNKSGLEIGPTPPKTIPLSERQAGAKALIRPHIEKMRPDMLTKLEL
jgi:hypothetical protein